MNPYSATRITPFALGALREEPWRNGGGVTRTVARREHDGRMFWRISIADISGSGPFSRFDGVEREAVLVAGGGLWLCGDWGSAALGAVGDRVRFPGEAAVHAQLSRPFARLWNVMTDRLSARCDVRVGCSTLERFGPIPEGALFVLAGAADVLVDGELVVTLNADEGLVFEDWEETMVLRFHDGPCHWLLTTFEKR